MIDYNANTHTHIHTMIEHKRKSTIGKARIKMHKKHMRKSNTKIKQADKNQESR